MLCLSLSHFNCHQRPGKRFKPQALTYPELLPVLLEVHPNKKKTSKEYKFFIHFKLFKLLAKDSFSGQYSLALGYKQTIMFTLLGDISPLLMFGLRPKSAISVYLSVNTIRLITPIHLVIIVLDLLCVIYYEADSIQLFWKQIYSIYNFFNCF